MKKRSRLLVSMTLVLVFIFGPLSTSAHEKDESGGYAETHYQFDMEKIALAVENKDILVVSPQHSANPFKQWRAENEKNKLEQYLCKYPDIEEQLVDMVNNNTYIAAFGYTEASMKYDKKEKTFVRVEKDLSTRSLMFDINTKAADKQATGEKEEKLDFTLVTTVTRRGVTNPYTYQTVSRATWAKKGSNDENYPSNDGYDFITQSFPSSLTLSSDSVSLTYSDGATPVKGKDYWRSDSSDNHITYTIQDDPSGIGWLKSANLLLNSKGNYSSKTRKIYSYYTHTWEDTDIKIVPSLGLNIDELLSFQLTIDSETTNKEWTVSCYVSFKF